MKAFAWLFLLATFAAAAEPQNNGLQDTVVLIIRHGEKPESGVDLAPGGVQRADAYVRYFKHLMIDNQPAKIDSLFASADSKNSHRPRLTLTPLANALDLPLNLHYSDKQSDVLATELKSKPHGKEILICWHHGQMPKLLKALGADPKALLPDGQWPTDVYGWMLVLHFDHDGHWIKETSQRINEKLMPDDTAPGDLQPRASQIR